MIYFLTMAYSLLLTATTIALAQTPAMARPQPPVHDHALLSEVTLLAGKPGVPGRRVGGGSRLY